MEYKKKLDRLQMSLFSTLYRKAGGYLIIPSHVFSGLRKTEWGKLKNYNYALKVIEDVYYKEANLTMDCASHRKADSQPADSRFGTNEARPNRNMVNSYKNFVLEVGKRLGFKFKANFEYFEKAL